MSGSFPTRLRAARAAAGLSIRGLAAKAKVSISSVQNWDRGDSLPRIDTVEVVAHALNVTPAWLAFGEDHDPDRS